MCTILDPLKPIEHPAETLIILHGSECMDALCLKRARRFFAHSQLHASCVEVPVETAADHDHWFNVSAAYRIVVMWFGAAERNHDNGMAHDLKLARLKHLKAERFTLAVGVSRHYPWRDEIVQTLRNPSGLGTIWGEAERMGVFPPEPPISITLATTLRHAARLARHRYVLPSSPVLISQAAE